MDQVTSAQPGLRAAGGGAEVHPVVEYFVGGEPGQNAGVKDGPAARSAGGTDEYRQQSRQPGAEGEDGAGVVMVNVVKRSHEGREPMAHPAVNSILKEGPA